ncbi:MAG: hypothetical protein ACOYOP_04000 [Microthrixaceae bacterium]
MSDLRAARPDPRRPAVVDEPAPLDDASGDPPSGDPSAGDLGTGDRTGDGRRRSDLVVGTLLAVGVFVLLLARNRWIFGPVHFAGDEANQFATAWDAITLQDLRGNGSRTGFHHPGPGYLYIWGLAEVVRRVLQSPIGQHNADMLGGFALVSAQLGAIGAIVRSHLGSWLHGVVVLGALALFCWLEPGILAGPWLPHMFTASFALMVVAGASAAAGRLPSLVAFVAGVGFLFHGHVAFTSFVGVATLMVLVATWRTGDLRRLVTEERRTLWAALGLGLAFVTPIIGYTLTSWPGETTKYWDYLQRPDTGGHGLTDGARFVLQFWPGTNTVTRALVLVVAFAALVGVSWWRRSRLGFFLVGGAAAMELCLLQYATGGVDDLSFRYVALWILAIPGLVVGTTLALLLPEWVRHPATTPRRVAVGAVAVAAVAAAAISPATRYTPYDFFETPKLVDQLVRTADGRTIVITADPEAVGSYQLAPAVVSEATDRGVRVCLTDPGWVVKFGEDIACTRRDLATGSRWTFLSADQPLPPAIAATSPRQWHSAFVVPGTVRER